jgi:hypothetical protein
MRLLSIGQAPLHRLVKINLHDQPSAVGLVRRGVGGSRPDPDLTRPPLTILIALVVKGNRKSE